MINEVICCFYENRILFYDSTSSTTSATTMTSYIKVRVTVFEIFISVGVV